MDKTPVWRRAPRKIDEFIIYAIPGYRSGVLYAGHETQVNLKERQMVVEGRKSVINIVAGFILRDKDNKTSYCAEWRRLKNATGDDATASFVEIIETLSQEVDMDDVLGQFYFAGRNYGNDIDEQFVAEKLCELGVYEELITKREHRINLELGVYEEKIKEVV